MKKVTWFYVLLTLVVLAGGAYLGFEMFMKPQKENFLIGGTTHGHHQIELACATCHQSPFGGGEVLQEACVDCHGAELAKVDDSHPKSKFTDPRNADRLEEIDARYCVACHREHQPELTQAMGVTLPQDFCISCHHDIAEDRSSHEGMEFDTCASAGCHNFHDNKALYEDFLLAHRNEPAIAEAPVVAAMQQYVVHKSGAEKQIPAPDYPQQATEVADIVAQWSTSAHAHPDSNCSACHGAAEQWVDQPDVLVCADCHDNQTRGFLSGKHGMRLSVHQDPVRSYPINPSLRELQEGNNRMFSPMRPELGRLPFKADAMHNELTCNTCHKPHGYELKQAAIDACLGCHEDDHTQAYKESPHYQLVLREETGELPLGSGVTCATCHLPKVEDPAAANRFITQHNINENLRPNEKMVRTVCLDCHGLQFTLDSLADPQLIRSNFNGRSKVAIDSIQMAIDREEE